MASWVATALGLGGGIALAILVGQAALPRLIRRSPNVRLSARLALGGTLAALLPALLLSVVVGGTLGSAWGREVFRELGIGSSGVPFGVAAGTALAFAAVVLLGAAAGLVLARLLR